MKSVTKVVRGCLRTTKVAIFVVYCDQSIEKVTWLPFHKELLAKNNHHKTNKADIMISNMMHQKQKQKEKRKLAITNFANQLGHFLII